MHVLDQRRDTVNVLSAERDKQVCDTSLILSHMFVDCLVNGVIGQKVKAEILPVMVESDIPQITH